MAKSRAGAAESPWDRILTVDEAAAYLNVTSRFVRRLVAERRVSYLKVGRLVRFDTKDLDEFLRQGRVECEAVG